MTKTVQDRDLYLPPFNGRINIDYDYPSFINLLNRWRNGDESAVFEVIHKGRNRVRKVSFYLKNAEKTNLIFKEFRLKGITRLKSTFLPSKAHRAWEGALALWERELNTPKPIAFLERPEFPGIKEAFFITESLEDFEEIRHLLLKTNGERLKNMVKALAEYMYLCHSKGIIHRDLSDGNVLTKQNERGDYIFYLIDTNRIRIESCPGLLKRIKSLIRLGIPPDLQTFFLEVYTGKKPVGRKLWLWYRMNKRTFELYLRLKKLLRIKKLAEILKIQ